MLTLLVTRPLYSQPIIDKEPNKPFINKGTLLTGFSFSFINGSGNEYNQDFAREATQITANIEALYFVTERIGLGPVVSYGFTYRDLLNVIAPSQGDVDRRRSLLALGLKAGYYIPLNNILTGSSNYFFLTGALISRRVVNERENRFTLTLNELGYRIGSGLLIPVGNQISIITKLSLRAHRHEYRFGIERNNEIILITETRWPKKLSLSIGLNVVF